MPQDSRRPVETRLPPESIGGGLEPEPARRPEGAAADLADAQFGPVGSETLPWVPRFDVEALSRRKRDALPTTYQAAIPSRIANAGFTITPALAADAEDAGATIMRLDAYMSAKFGDGEIAPMQSVLLRSESAASSQIENLTVGARQLAIAELGGAASHNAELVSRNVRAMDAAIDMADRMDTNSIRAMHRALLAGHDPDAGRWRDVQVWIGSSGLSPQGAAFVPPRPGLVPDAVDDLVAFIARTDLPVLLHAAVAHAQFETIHPFTDGNGRTGRALLHAMIRRSGLTSRITVPISAGLLSDTRAYFAALDAYREGDLRPIVTQLSEASRKAATQGRHLVNTLADIRQAWQHNLRSRAGSAGRRLLDVLIGQPAVHATYVQHRLAVSNTAARRAIDQALAAGILHEASDRKRNRIYLARDVIDALDDFAEESGRRGW
jgi:Fic family protein